MFVWLAAPPGHCRDRKSLHRGSNLEAVSPSPFAMSQGHHVSICVVYYLAYLRERLGKQSTLGLADLCGGLRTVRTRFGYLKKRSFDFRYLAYSSQWLICSLGVAPEQRGCSQSDCLLYVLQSAWEHREQQGATKRSADRQELHTHQQSRSNLARTLILVPFPSAI